MSEEPEDDCRSFKDWVLQRETELRLEVGHDDTIDLKLITGSAEVFGTELAPGRVYTICSRLKIAVFTWYGCTLRIPSVHYQSKETPMLMYLNAHSAIDQLRTKFQADNRVGPKVLVVGPTDVGKSTICRLLLNYAVRMGRQPCFVDIDVGQGSICIPGSIAMLPVVRPCDIETGEFSKKASLVYHFGHTSPGHNLKLYKAIVTELVSMFNERCQSSQQTKVGGCVINSCGWVDGGGYKALLHAALAFEVDVVLVLDHERLFHDLQRELPSSTHIVPLPKSGGVVVRSREFRKMSRHLATREYFYGKKSHRLFPFSFEVAFSDVELLKIGAPAVPASALPIGMEQEDGSTQLIPVEPSRSLVHSIFSLSMATSLEEDLTITACAGLLCIAAVDEDAKTMTVLSPAQGPLPRKFLLQSDIKFLDLE